MKNKEDRVTKFMEELNLFSFETRIHGYGDISITRTGIGFANRFVKTYAYVRFLGNDKGDLFVAFSENEQLDTYRINIPKRISTTKKYCFPRQVIAHWKTHHPLGGFTLEKLNCPIEAFYRVKDDKKEE